MRQDRAARQHTSKSLSGNKTKITIKNDSIATKNNGNMLTEIGRRVLEHKEKQTTRIINIKKNRVKIGFKKRDIVWLQILNKIYCPTEFIKLSYYVLELGRKVNNFYPI
jgi:hypothetical protein